MKKRKHNEQKGCKDKETYMSKSAAKGAVRRGIKLGYYPTTASYYVCDFCANYHTSSARELRPR